jgi:hypothetical protein
MSLLGRALIALAVVVPIGLGRFAALAWLSARITRINAGNRSAQCAAAGVAAL